MPVAALGGGRSTPTVPSMGMHDLRTVALGLALFGTISALSSACGDPDDDTGAAAIRTLADANNYRYSGALQIASTPVRAQQDVAMDWSALTVDLQNRALDAATEIDQVGLLYFRYLSEAEVQAALSDESLRQSDIDLFLNYLNDAEGTVANLSEFGLLGNPFDITEYFVEGDGSWLLLPSTGTTPGQGARTLHFMAPDAASENSEVRIDDDSCVLDFEVSLRDLSPVAVEAGATPVVDWSGLTVDGLGNTLDLGLIDEVWVGRVESEDLSALEAGFLGLEETAAEVYVLQTGGTRRANLGDLTSGGAPFAGPTKDGTWLLSLRCSTCFTPAPPFLTVLEVR